MLLDGSPVVAATESMRKKLEAEYATVEKDLLDKFPEVILRVGGGRGAFFLVVVVFVRLSYLCAAVFFCVFFISLYGSRFFSCCTFFLGGGGGGRGRDVGECRVVEWSYSCYSDEKHLRDAWME